jgi:hypothetical protein
MPHVSPEIVDAFVPDLVAVLDVVGGARRHGRAVASTS